MTEARIVAVTFQSPPLVKMEEFANLVAADPGGDTVAQVIRNSAITTKGMAVNALLEDPRRWTTRRRMDRSLTEARRLGSETVSAALAEAGLRPEEVGLFATVTTTTHSAPGLDALAPELGLRGDVELLSLGPMGCYAAVPAVSACAHWVAVKRRPAVLLAVDLFSPHVQPPPYDKEQAVVLTLFGDGAAAVVLVPGGTKGGAQGGPRGRRPGSERTAGPARGPVAGSARGPAAGSPWRPAAGSPWGRTVDEQGGVEIVDAEQLTAPAHAEDLQVHMGDSGLRIRLKPSMPDVVAGSVAIPARALLARHGVRWADVAWWAVHPGGRRILDRVDEALGLPERSMATARDVMREYGNTAAPAVLEVLRRLQTTRPLAAGEHGVVLACGPGATVWALLLRGA